MTLTNEKECKIYDRIYDIINSCKTMGHISVTYNMICNFQEIISKDNKLMIDILNNKMMKQISKIRNDLKK